MERRRCGKNREASVAVCWAARPHRLGAGGRAPDTMNQNPARISRDGSLSIARDIHPSGPKRTRRKRPRMGRQNSSSEGVVNKSLQIAMRSISSSEISSLRRSYSLVVRGDSWLANLLGDFQLAAVLQGGRDARRAEGIIVDLCFDAGGLRAALDHAPCVRLVHGFFSQKACFAGRRADR